MLENHFVCPYCFEKSSLKTIAFRCKNNPAKCSPVNDSQLAAFEMVGTKMAGKVFLPAKKGSARLKLSREAACPDCQAVSHTRLCPSCHNELPFTIGEHRDYIFAIIGAKEAGKSHYISVLINAIKNEIGVDFNSNLHPINDATIKRFREEFYKPIFVDKTTIQATRSARADIRVRLPLIYTLSFMGKNLFGKKKIKKVATVTFFDTAGEDLNDQDVMRTENKYIYNSQGIIVLVDPLQLPAVRDQLADKNIELPRQNTEIEDILSRTASLIRRAKGLKENQIIDIPIAVAFSKCDALMPLLTDSALQYPSDHRGYFDQTDFRDVHGEIEARLIEWSGAYLGQQLELYFRHYAFFGLSALGCNPGGSQKISSVRPLRVADPFLWLLAHHGLIQSKERKT